LRRWTWSLPESERALLLGFRIPKAKTSNRAAPQLTAARITYVATDAWACRELFLRFQNLGLMRSKPAPADSGAALQA
jgi:hypothetical protein